MLKKYRYIIEIIRLPTHLQVVEKSHPTILGMNRVHRLVHQDPKMNGMHPFTKEDKGPETIKTFYGYQNRQKLKPEHKVKEIGLVSQLRDTTKVSVIYRWNKDD